MSTKSPSSSCDRGLVIAYDGDCPFCSSYVKRVRLVQAAGNVRMVDARGSAPFLDEIRAAGMNLNKGMVAKYEGTFYQGDQVLTLVALLTTRSGRLNRLLALIFRSPFRAKLIYPALVLGRRLTLFLMGRKLIR